MMTLGKTLGNQMTGPRNHIPVPKHHQHVTLEREKQKCLHGNLNGGGQCFLYQEKKKVSLYPSRVLCPQTAEAPHCCRVHPHGRDVPRASGTGCHRSVEWQLPLSQCGRGCVPPQASTSPACLPPPGSRRGALPAHAARSSATFSCPPHKSA